jgi:AraC-like DNA-binding protein
MDIIWDGERLFVAGPDTLPNPTMADAPFMIGVRFQPGAGPVFLGVPADELRDRRVDLAWLWPDAGRIEDRLAACRTLRQSAALLEECIVRRVPTVSEPDRVVEAAAVAWRRGSTPADIAGLAERIGITERQLHRRFVQAVGYGPRLLHRVLRFQRFLAECRTPTVRLAELAFRAGYADQAHLSREARVLAGRTPAELRAARLRVRNVQDLPSGIGYNSYMCQPSRNIQ